MKPGVGRHVGAARSLLPGYTFGSNPVVKSQERAES